MQNIMKHAATEST